MKRLVLFISIVLSFQLTFGTAFAANYATQLVQYVDFEGTNTSFTGTDYKEDLKNGTGYIKKDSVFGTISDGSPNHCLEFGAKSDGTTNRPYLRLDLSAKEGTLTFEGKIYFSSAYSVNDALMFYWTNTSGSSKHTDLDMKYDTNTQKTALGGVEIPIGEFVDFKYVFDIASSNVTPYYNGNAYSPVSISGLKSVDNVRIQPYTAENPGYYLLDNVKISQTTEQGEITSINSDADLPYDSTQFSFEMTKLPSNLKPEYIEVLGGSTKLVGTSVSTEGTKVTAVLNGKLESSTTYTLKILKAAYVENTETDTAVDVTATFDTAMREFDIRKPTYQIVGSDCTISTEISNTSSGEKSITLMAVTYEADSAGNNRIVDIAAASYTIPEYSPGESVSINGITLGANRLVKLYVIDGWAGKRPVFGKAWTADYESLIR